MLQKVQRFIYFINEICESLLQAPFEERQSCVIIYEPRQEEDGRKHNRKGSMKSSMTKRALKASGQTDLSSNASKDILLMHRFQWVRTRSGTIWPLEMLRRSTFHRLFEMYVL